MNLQQLNKFIIISSIIDMLVSENGNYNFTKIYVPIQLESTIS